MFTVEEWRIKYILCLDFWSLSKIVGNDAEETFLAYSVLLIKMYLLLKAI